VRRRLSYRDHLGVRGRVLQHLYLVMRPRYYSPFAHYYRSDGHFILLEGVAGLLQGLGHIKFMLFKHIKYFLLAQNAGLSLACTLAFLRSQKYIAGCGITHNNL